MLRTKGACPPSLNKDAHPSVLSFRFDCFDTFSIALAQKGVFETKKGTTTMSRQTILCVPWVSHLPQKQQLALLLVLHCSRSNIISSICHLVPRALKLPVQGCQLSNAGACKPASYLNEYACSLSRHVGAGMLCGMDIVVAQPAQNRALKDTRPLLPATFWIHSHEI